MPPSPVYSDSRPGSHPVAQAKATVSRDRCLASSLMKLRVGVVGLGKAWETRHRPALRALSDRFEVRAICDQVAHRADTAAREFGACAVDGFRALAARNDVDVILMLAPQWYGALPIFAACTAGKAVDRKSTRLNSSHS